MSISNKILQFVWLGGLLLCAIVTIQIIYGQRASRLITEEQVANKVVNDISSLLLVVDDFEDRNNIRLFQNWQRRFNHLSESLADHPELSRKIEYDLELLHDMIDELYEIQSSPPMSALSIEQRSKRIRKQEFIYNRNDIAIRHILSKSIRYSREVSQRQKHILLQNQAIQIGLIMIFISLFIMVILRFLHQLSDSFSLLSQKINLTSAAAERPDGVSPDGSFSFREFNIIQDNFYNLLGRIKLVNQQLDENRIKLEKAADRERAAVASELHDNITQLLGMAKMQLNNVALEFSDIQKHHRFEKSQALINQATEEIRHLSHRIMPSSIKDFGIVLSVQELLSEVEHSSNLKTKLVNNKDVRLNDEKELNVYRIIQEATTNTVKHAQATCILVDLQFGKSTLLVRVIDDGVGFYQAEKPCGIGLRTMHNRAKRIQAVLDISSDKTGTTTTLKVPIN